MPDKPPVPPLTYRDAGVNSAAGISMLHALQRLGQRTHSTRVLLAGPGTAGLFRLDYNEKLFARNYREPVLLAATNGVGSKLKIAASLKRYDTVGMDLVAMSVNDLVVQGGEPLFFLHHVALHTLEPLATTQIVKGISDGCVEAGCALLGGETAEMPDLYAAGEFDMSGFAVGVVEKRRILEVADVEPGDSVIGLASSGLHSNGYALVRRVVEKSGVGLQEFIPELKTTLAEELLRPTRLYVRSVQNLLGRYKVKKIIKSMAHITGGGLGAGGNLSRILPPGLSGRLKRDAWNPPPIFTWLQKHGPVDADEMYAVFNMGIGFVIIVRPTFTRPILSALRTLGEKPFFLGKIRKGGPGELSAVEWS